MCPWKSSWLGPASLQTGISNVKGNKFSEHPSCRAGAAWRQVCGDVAPFPWILAAERNPNAPSLGVHYHAWICSLAFCGNLAALTVSSTGIYSFSRNVSWTGATPLAGAVVAMFLLFFVLGVRLMGPSICFTVITITSFSSFSSLSQQLRLLASQSGFITSTQTLIRSSLCLPIFANSTLKSPTYYSTLPPCLPALKLPKQLPACLALTSIPLQTF